MEREIRFRERRGGMARILLRRAVAAAALVLAACAAPPAPPAPSAPPPAAPEPAPAAPEPAVPAPDPAEQALRSYVESKERLERVAAPLLANNAKLCKGAVHNLLGFSARNKYSYPNEYAEVAQKLYGLGERLQVTGVWPGSGAARVGVRQGDVLVAAGGKPVPQGPDAKRKAVLLLAPLVRNRKSLALVLARDGGEIALTVPLTPACAFGVEPGMSDNVSAYADGARVLVTRGMLRFAASDDELAYVLAREMAHNALRHPLQQKTNASAGALIDRLARPDPEPDAIAAAAALKPVRAALDAAADRLALYMLARADYDIGRADAFWQRLANQYPASVADGYTALHPSIDARLSAVNKTVAEIRAKQDANKALMP